MIRSADPLRGLPAPCPGDDFGGGLSHRMDGDRGFEFVQKLSALLTTFRRIGTMDSVGEFRHGQRADDDRHVADHSANVLEHAGVVCFDRSAATRTLESRTSPRTADAMVHGGT